MTPFFLLIVKWSTYPMLGSSWLCQYNILSFKLMDIIQMKNGGEWLTGVCISNMNDEKNGYQNKDNLSWNCPFYTIEFPFYSICVHFCTPWINCQINMRWISLVHKRSKLDGLQPWKDLLILYSDWKKLLPYILALEDVKTLLFLAHTPPLPCKGLFNWQEGALCRTTTLTSAPLLFFIQ